MAKLFKIIQVEKDRILVNVTPENYPDFVITFMENEFEDGNEAFIFDQVKQKVKAILTANNMMARPATKAKFNKLKDRVNVPEVVVLDPPVEPPVP